jgi:hypothetical protein
MRSGRPSRGRGSSRHFIAIFGLIDAVFVAIATESFVDGFAVALLPLVTLWYLARTTSGGVRRRRPRALDDGETRAIPASGLGAARRTEAMMRIAPTITRSAGQNRSRCRSGTIVRTRKYEPITMRTMPAIAAPA